MENIFIITMQDFEVFRQSKNILLQDANGSVFKKKDYMFVMEDVS